MIVIFNMEIENPFAFQMKRNLALLLNIYKLNGHGIRFAYELIVENKKLFYVWNKVKDIHYQYESDNDFIKVINPSDKKLQLSSILDNCPNRIDFIKKQ